MRSKCCNTLLSCIFTVILLLAGITINAQVPIEDLLSKYQDIDKLQTFNLTKEQLAVSKKISLNLGIDQKDLIRHSDEQYTLTYTGNNPSRESFYNEASDILNSKGYFIVKESTTPVVSSITYAFADEEKIKELVIIIRNDNAVTIVVSKGDFDKNKYKDIKKTDVSQ